ncbi:DUF6282 family protein [Methanobacterium ferruginis]|uniref:DUF6282 family protein n=1 Tax=Methanobacterium ferruginis TaxID=710191 RepID=UPI0025731886|nr:DUF6282 family protein [Methanobacterium ferruginis]MCC7550375.1 hypothetical protein [Methanobacterium sp.]BDZ69114.1 hypothetical protein GCM10025860_25620 [Methanobacterium ferruginis]
MNNMDPEEILHGFLDTHIHTSPDIKPRLLDDYEAALEAKEKGMRAIVLKSHTESTAGRAYIAHRLTGFSVFGGITLNQTVGGLNPEAVRSAALLGAKIIWLPTIHHQDIKIEQEPLQDILHLIKKYNLVLATGHLKPQEIFQVLDECHSIGVEKVLINHPLTGVVGASLDEQKEMARQAYLEHCWVATMPQHDKLNPTIMADAIKEVGAQRCILATDFGQKHNPSPVRGMLLMIENMIKEGISWREITIMCKHNPEKLLF